MNEIKFGYWKEIAAHIGLIYPGPKLKQFSVCIDPDLGKAFIHLFLTSVHIINWVWHFITNHTQVG